MLFQFWLLVFAVTLFAAESIAENELENVEEKLLQFSQNEGFNQYFALDLIDYLRRIQQSTVSFSANMQPLEWLHGSWSCNKEIEQSARYEPILGGSAILFRFKVEIRDEDTLRKLKVPESKWPWKQHGYEIIGYDPAVDCRRTWTFVFFPGAPPIFITGKVCNLERDTGNFIIRDHAADMVDNDVKYRIISPSEHNWSNAKVSVDYWREAEIPIHFSLSSLIPLLMQSAVL